MTNAQNITIDTTNIPGATVSIAQIAGAGDPMLMLHGHADSHKLWLPLIDALNTDHHFILPDLPGYGGSMMHDDYDLSLDNRARFVQHVLDAANITEPIVLVVHDHGGPFGLAWAVTHPEKVKALIILDTIFHSDYQWHFWGRVWRTPILGEISVALTTRRIMIMEMRRGSKGLPVSYIKSAHSDLTPHTALSALKLYRATDPSIFVGWDEKLYQFVSQKPTMALWGEKDPYISIKFAERLQSHGARLHRFPNCGHWLSVEAPDECAKDIRAFLKTV